MNKIDRSVIDKAMTYATYRSLIDEHLYQNKTSGSNHSELMIHYTQMNVRRMNRLDRKAELTEESRELLAGIRQPMIWLVLTEAWCGDAAQIIPVLNRMAETSDQIDLRLIFRDEHPEIMDAFLTKGARSIPKLIVLDADSLEVRSSWGPRPLEAQKIVMEGKKERETIQDKELKKAKYEETAIVLQKWYARDKTIRIQKELLEAVLEEAEA